MDIRKPYWTRGKITLKFETPKLLKWFGLPEDLDNLIEYGNVDDSTPLTDDAYMTVEEDEDGNLVDMDGKPVSEEAQQEIYGVRVSALESGTQARAARAVMDALEEALMTFSDYKYDYYLTSPDSAIGNEYLSGTAKGIENVDVKRDYTTIVANKDIVHVINTMIDGVGLFYATHDLEGESINVFIKTRFKWLKEYWDIYGGKKPEPDLDRIDSFDEKYYIDLLRGIEKTYKIRILSQSSREAADKRTR